MAALGVVVVLYQHMRTLAILLGIVAVVYLLGVSLGIIASDGSR